MTEAQVKEIIVKAHAFDAIEKALLETDDPSIGGINALTIVAGTRIKLSNIVKENVDGRE